MTEFLEKCPMTKEPKNLDNLFKLISNYLDDRWFLCKLDLLNCTMSLIFTAGKSFKPYATICLFKVIDYLTDEEWMKRKLAINIVYGLIFYCKEEIYTVKDNIVEFLFVLQKDPVKEVREACVRTLNYIDEVYPKKENSKDLKSINLLFNKRLNNKKYHRNKSANKSYDAIYKKGDLSSRIDTSRSNKINNRSAIKKRTVNNYMDKLKKELDGLDKLEKQYNEKRINFNDSKKKERRRNNYYSQDFGMNSSSTTRILLEHFNTTLQNILQQIKIIKEEQNELKLMFDDVKQIVDKNYFNLNERLKLMEGSSIYNEDRINNRSASKSSNHKNYK
jgi:AraC-like DNA-binding protein